MEIFIKEIFFLGRSYETKHFRKCFQYRNRKIARTRLWVQNLHLNFFSTFLKNSVTRYICIYIWMTVKISSIYFHWLTVIWYAFLWNIDSVEYIYVRVRVLIYIHTRYLFFNWLLEASVALFNKQNVTRFGNGIND